MTLTTLLQQSRIWPQLRSGVLGVNSTRPALCSRVGVVIVVIWLVMTRPFLQHIFVALSAMTFATFLFPNEMMFVARHPSLVLAVPFAAGFVGTNLGRSPIRTAAAWIVLGLLAVAICKSVYADAAANLWLQSVAGV